ncbi:MAG: DMT family transporter [Thermoanaerobaculia bacterium]
MSGTEARHAASGATYGIAAAMLFGLSAPVSKRLLLDVPPLMLAALLYVGAAIGLVIAAPFAPRRERREAPVRRTDVPLLAGIVITGGILGPLLMLLGLQRVSGLAGSLLLNLEAVFTMLVALLVFREHLSRRELAGAALVVGGAAVLGFAPGELRAQLLGVACIALACLSWAFDNNWTQRLSLKDPFAVVRIKTLGAGTCMLVLALLLGQRMPRPSIVIAALVLGVFSYGVSILLDAYALRHIGAAREAAFFATAPFMGALAAVPILGERPRAMDLVALSAMAVGVAVLLRPKHEHVHTHDAMNHEHIHIHDGHHQHEHLPADPPGEPHAHTHRHTTLTHAHTHVSDIHHRHDHPWNPEP